MNDQSGELANCSPNEMLHEFGNRWRARSRPPRKASGRFPSKRRSQIKAHAAAAAFMIEPWSNCADYTLKRSRRSSFSVQLLLHFSQSAREDIARSSAIFSPRDNSLSLSLKKQIRHNKGVTVGRRCGYNRRGSLSCKLTRTAQSSPPARRGTGCVTRDCGFAHLPK